MGAITDTNDTACLTQHRKQKTEHAHKNDQTNVSTRSCVDLANKQ